MMRMIPIQKPKTVGTSGQNHNEDKAVISPARPAPATATTAANLLNLDQLPSSTPQRRYKPLPALTAYYGGKSLRLGHYIAQMCEATPHTFYVEPFGGMFGVGMAKVPSPVEIYNDFSNGLVTLFEVVRDPVRAKELERRLRLTPYSRVEWKRCVVSYNSGAWRSITDPIEQARQVYTMLDQSFNGTLKNGGWSFGGYTHDGNVALQFRNGLDNIEAISHRLRNVIIECGDAFTLITRWGKGENVLLYCDPPYVLESRGKGNKGKHYYEKELTNPEHRTHGPDRASFRSEGQSYFERL